MPLHRLCTRQKMLGQDIKACRTLTNSRQIHIDKGQIKQNEPTPRDISPTALVTR
ncbi:hypothetical protein SK128_003396 [Halocaridina rubra]|uniref:Uncharacterized protein n=1 Tax=Halocaridina rubra TaxID=373956 RepID=A0AAN9A5H6_HALRR